MKFNGKSGDKVASSGTYQNKYGKSISLKEGEIFPTCPKKGRPIDWEKVN